MKHLDLLFDSYRLVDRVSRRRANRTLDRKPNQRYSIWLLVKIHLAIGWQGWTRNLFYEKLRTEGGALRRELKLPNRLPSYSQLKKRMKRRAFEQALAAVLSESGREVLRRLGPPEVETALMDLTNVPGSPADHQSRRGTDGKTWFWGYKLGLLTSRSGVVLGAAAITANLVERSVTARLIRSAGTVVSTLGRKMRVKYLLGDCGFAGDITYRQAHRYLHCRLLSPPRRKATGHRTGPSVRLQRMRLRSPHRYQDWGFWQTPTARRIYRRRTQIERRWSQLTDHPFDLDHRPRGTVGVAAVLRWAEGKLILWNVAVNDNIRCGREIWKLKPYVA
jgi:hypothetical protein